jgi:D-serine deaminase-like pyridoxal phosphate-dependent protein
MTPAPTLAHLPTPAAIVDLDVMEANLARMAGYAARHGLRLRPHVKTHKSPRLAAEQLRLGAAGLTVATLREAVTMRPVGGELLLAYPPVGDWRLAALTRIARDSPVAVALDSADALAGLGAAAARAGVRVTVLVEFDAGMRRCGVMRPADAVDLARRAAGHPSLEFGGLLFYPGHIRDAVPEQAAALRALAEELAGYIEALKQAGLEPAVVSGGSTPTAFASHEVPGITEIRPGTYVFNDRTTALLGACAWHDCAFTVLATVVSTSVPGAAVIDAGSKALSREEVRSRGAGFGALLDRPGVAVAGLSEEHGILDLSGSDWRPRIGERVRVVPNHVCVCVNLQKEVLGVRGDTVVSRWPVSARHWDPGTTR